MTRGQSLPLLLAHRGDVRSAAENSVAALLAGAAAVDGIEFDVRIARDGVPVVIHDADLNRVHGVDRRVGDLTARELEPLGIPALADVLAAVPRRAFLDVELKEPPTHVVVEVLASGRGPDLSRAAISSFEAAALRRIAALAPGWPRWLNVEGPITEASLAAATGLGCAAISADWRSIDARAVDRVRQAGLSLAAWTVRRRPTRRRLARLGVIAICVEGRALAAWSDDERGALDVRPGRGCVPCPMLHRRGRRDE